MNNCDTMQIYTNIFFYFKTKPKLLKSVFQKSNNVLNYIIEIVINESTVR